MIYCTPHASTRLLPVSRFKNRSLRTHLDLLLLNVESAVRLNQAKQKAQHDTHTLKEEVSIGESIMHMVKNFRAGSPWLPSTITEQLGPVTYLVQVKNNLTWKHCIDQLRSGHQPVYGTIPDSLRTNDSLLAPATSTDVVTDQYAPMTQYPQ